MPQSRRGGRVGRGAAEAPLMEVSVSRTPRGMTVASAFTPHARSVTVGVWIRAGSRAEPARLNGISHFVEHLMFKGTRRRSAREISIAIEGRGGHLNAFTSEEHTCYYARMTREELPRALEVISDMLQHSRFTPENIEKERDVILDEIVMYRDQPQQLVQDELMMALWPGHPLGRPVVGTAGTVARIARADLLAFVRDEYRADRVTLAFAGNLPHAVGVELAARYFSGMPGGAGARVWRGGGRAGAGAVRVMARDTEQAQLALGFRLFGEADPRRHALKILNAVVGENMSSRLFQAVRERYGLAYSIHSSIDLFCDCGFMAIYAGMEAGRTARTLAVVMRELRRLRERPVSVAELRRAKDYMIGQLRLSLEGTTAQMMWIGDDMVTRGAFISPESTIEGMARVTAEEVRALAAQCLRPEALRLAAVLPEPAVATEAALRKALAGL